MTDQTEPKNALAKLDFSQFNFGGAVSAAPTQIQTTTGEMIDLPDGVDLMDYIDPSGGGKPLGQIKIGQPSDDLYPRELYYSENTRDVDEITGEVKKSKAVKYLGNNVVVYPLGFMSPFTRSMMPEKFDPSGKPLCRSTNGITPDLEFAGLLDGKNIQCAVLNSKTRQLETICPFANWEANGGNKPPCGEQYVVFVALSYKESEESEPEMLIAEARFKSATAQEGRYLVGTLRQLQRQQVPLYEMPIKLIGRKEKQGMVVAPIYKATNLARIPDEDIPTFESAVRRVQDAISYLQKKAQTPRENRVTNGTAVDANTISVQGYVRNTSPNLKAMIAKATSGNGNEEPLI